jgi:membrane fusion protein, heavy metal efflux system
MFRNILILKSALMVLLVISSCAPHEHTHEHADEHAGQSVPNDTLHMSVEMLGLAGVSWGPPPTAQLMEGEPLFGEWVLFPEHRALVSGIAPGRVRRLLYQLNDEVVRGAPLVELESPDWTDLQRRYFTHMAQGQFLQQEYARMETLQAQDATSAKVWQQVRAEMTNWRTTRASLEADLRMYGVKPETLDPESPQAVYTLYAPIGGRVVHSLASTGQWMGAGDPACELADLRKIMVSLKARPEQASGLQTGDSLLLETEGFPGTLTARIRHMDRMADPASQTIGIHALPQAAGPLPPIGRFVQARRPGHIPEGQWLLPAEALRKETGEDFILVHLPGAGDPGEEAFLRRRVRILRMGPEGVLIERPAGWKSGMELVLKGAYYLDAHARSHEFEHDH